MVLHKPSNRDEDDEQQQNDEDDADFDASLPRELLRVGPAAQAGLRALEAREKGNDVVDAGEAALKLALVTLCLD